MAKPVKETPILFGEEARQFEVRMLHPKPLSPERIETIRRDYEFLRKKCFAFSSLDKSNIPFIMARI